MQVSYQSPNRVMGWHTKRELVQFCTTGLVKWKEFIPCVYRCDWALRFVQ